MEKIVEKDPSNTDKYSYTYNMNKPMTEAEAREVFDAIINQTEDANLRDDRILLREYFCNQNFRANMAEMVHEAAA